MTEQRSSRVFISYSHADDEWLERLKRHLRPLIRQGRLDCWDDTRIQPGDDWRQEIQKALAKAQVAVLLMSANFFASDFINENELPPLLAAAQAKGVRILPVILSACRFARDPSLGRFQSISPPDRPLNEMPIAEQEKVLDRLAETIEFTISGATSRASGQQTESNRHRLLTEVRRVWIDGYLKHSLHNILRIELGLDENLDAVSRPWDLIVQQPDREPRPFPPISRLAPKILTRRFLQRSLLKCHSPLNHPVTFFHAIGRAVALVMKRSSLRSCCLQGIPPKPRQNQIAKSDPPATSTCP